MPGMALARAGASLAPMPILRYSIEDWHRLRAYRMAALPAKESMPPQTGIGCNYSRSLLELLERGALDVDWIKLSRLDAIEMELAQARPRRPVLLHMLPNAGCRPEQWEGFPWAELPRWASEAGSPHIALHLESRPEDWDEPIAIHYQTREQAQAVLRRFCAGIRDLRARLDLPVLVENCPLYPRHSMLRLCAQPEAIWQVLEETGAGLLLDASHVRCTAWHLGVDPRAYARALPLERVREIHLAGPRLVRDFGLRDRHFALQQEDWALLEWLLAHTQPQIVTLEYGGTGPLFETRARNDPAQLEAQLRRLHSLVVGG